MTQVSRRKRYTSTYVVCGRLPFSLCLVLPWSQFVPFADTSLLHYACVAYNKSLGRSIRSNSFVLPVIAPRFLKGAEEEATFHQKP